MNTSTTDHQLLTLAEFALTRITSDSAACAGCGVRTWDLSRGQVTPGILDRGPLCALCARELFPEFVCDLAAACNHLDDAASCCPPEQLVGLYHCVVGMARDFVFSPYLGLPGADS